MEEEEVEVEEVEDDKGETGSEEGEVSSSDPGFQTYRQDLGLDQSRLQARIGMEVAIFLCCQDLSNQRAVR